MIDEIINLMQKCRTTKQAWKVYNSALVLVNKIHSAELIDDSEYGKMTKDLQMSLYDIAIQKGEIYDL